MKVWAGVETVKDRASLRDIFKEEIMELDRLGIGIKERERAIESLAWGSRIMAEL